MTAWDDVWNILNAPTAGGYGGVREFSAPLGNALLAAGSTANPDEVLYRIFRYGPNPEAPFGVFASLQQDQQLELVAPFAGMPSPVGGLVITDPRTPTPTATPTATPDAHRGGLGLALLAGLWLLGRR